MKNIKKTKINIGVSGAGRTGGLAGYLAEEDDICIYGVYDPDFGRAKTMLSNAGNPGGIVFKTYSDMIQCREIDAVMVGSPNAYHKEQIISAFAAGKHVFSEKPLAPTVADCKAITDAHKKTNLLFATGFCMRYARLYQRAKEILDSGVLGKIISIDANENINPGHGAMIMTNWRRYKEIAGPHILEKCCHDLDLLNWFTGSVPRRVCAFGGNNFFIPEHAHLLKKSQQFNRLKEYWDKDTDPFTSEKNIEDNLVAILEFYNGARAQFQATMCNTIPERRMYMHCTEGNIITEQYSAVLRWRTLTDNEEHVEKMTEFHDAHLEGYQKVHAEGDRRIMKEFAQSLRTGAEPKCSGQEGMRSAAAAIAVDQARIQNSVVDLGPVWEELGISRQLIT